MNWFQHDADSTQDAKVKKLLIRHGAIGYAVYFHCLELIIGNVCETNITFELEHDSEIIADNLKITGNNEKSGREIVESIMRTIVELGLFSEQNGHIFCYKLLKRINMSMTSNKNLREAIAGAKEINHDSIMTHHATYLPTKQPTIPEENTPEIPAIPAKKKRTRIQKEEKKVYGIFKNVFLSDSDFNSLKEAYTENVLLSGIEAVSVYVQGKPNKHYTDFNKVLLNWGIDAGKEAIQTGKYRPSKSISSSSENTSNAVKTCPTCGEELDKYMTCPKCRVEYDVTGRAI